MCKTQQQSWCVQVYLEHTEAAASLDLSQQLAGAVMSGHGAAQWCSGCLLLRASSVWSLTTPHHTAATAYVHSHHDLTGV